MTRWLSDERVIALRAAGRLHESTSGGVESRHASWQGYRREPCVGESPATLAVEKYTPCDNRKPEIAPGPLTLQCHEGRAVNQPARCGATSRSAASRSSVAPIYPLVTLCRSMKIAEPKPEHRFHPTRKWRFDYAWPAHMLALEVDGGVWTQGRHTRGAGAIADMEKLSEAAILGWRVLYAVPDQLHNGVALDRIIRALTDREAA